MSMPLRTKDEVIAYLRERMPDCPVVEVSGIFPSDDDIVKYGIYVDDVNMNIREPYKLGVTYSGGVYIATDVNAILFVSFQNDPQGQEVQRVIQELAQNTVFWDGYHEVSFTRDVVIGNRSEKHTYTFELRRLDFNNT
jgi:hypothetical protein